MPVKEACDSGGPKGGTPYVRQTSLLCHMLEFCLGATAGFFQDRSTIVAGTSHIIAIRIDYDFACCVGVVSPAWSIWGVPLLLLKLRGTNLRGLGRGLGGLVGSIWGVFLCF